MARITSRPNSIQLGQRIEALNSRVEALETLVGELALVIRDATVDVEPESGDLEWLSDNFAELSARYRGEAVAIDGRQVVAHAPDLMTVMALATEVGHPEALFTTFPVDEPGPRA